MKPGKVLVSMKTYLGDAVMTAPLLDALEAAGWQVTLLTAPLAAEALGRPNCIPFRKCRWLPELIAQAQKLRAREFDACIVVNRSFRAALFAKLAGIPIRIGHPVEGRSCFLTQAIPYNGTQFEALTVGALGRPLGIELLDPRPRIELSEEEREEGDRLRAGAEIMVQAGARYDEKRIPLLVLADAVRYWQTKGRQVALVGGPEEKAEAEQLIAKLESPVVNLVGLCDVRETMAVMAGAKVALGADTGVMHLAAAVGCPIVQAFGPTPVEKWGHAYEPHRILRAPNGDMSQLTTEMIVEAVGP